MACIYNKDFRLYLVFKNIEGLGEVEITEPDEFSSFSQKIVQKDKGYGRDVQLMEDNLSLVFNSGFFDTVDFPTTMPDGKIAYHLTQGFDFLLYARKMKGFEADCQLYAKNKDVLHLVGDVDFKGMTTDEKTKIAAKIIQSGKKQLLKRRSNLKIKVLGSEDLDSNYVAPPKTETLLLKAKPLKQVSEWNISKPFHAYTDYLQGGTFHQMFQNGLNIIKNSGIEGSLSILDRVMPTWLTDDGFYGKIYNFGVVDAIEDLTEVKACFKSMRFNYHIATDADFNSGWSTNNQAISLNVYVLPQGKDNYTQDDVISEFYEKWSHPNSAATGMKYSLDYVGIENVDDLNTPFKGDAKRYDIRFENVTLDLPSIPRGARMCMVFSMNRDHTIVGWTDGRLEMEVISTGINSTVPAVWIEDFYKQTAKKTSGHDVILPLFEREGKHGMQFVVNGNMMRGIDTEFPINFKDAFDTLIEVNCDHQIMDESIIIGHEKNFYPNVDLGGFLQAADDSFEVSTNDKLAIIELSFGYSIYEQGKDEKNTNDAVHTESQWHVPNDKVENKKNIKIKQVRDFFKAETVRKEGTRGNSSNPDDESMFFFDVVELPAGTNGGFQATLMHNINTNDDLELMNDDTFNWYTTGLQVGGYFTIDTEKNNGIFIVKAISKTRLTLVGAANYSGVDLTKVSFVYSNVSYTIRTSEGFWEINGILSPNDFANLNYTQKRNILEWLPYLSSCMLYSEKDITNTSFKNNSKLTTLKYIGDVKSVNEGEPIKKADLNQQLINTNIITTGVVCGHAQALQLIRDMEKITNEKDVSGFVRIFDSNNDVRRVFCKEVDYEIATGYLSIVGEEKFDKEDLEVVISNGAMTIAGIPYLIDFSREWYYTEGVKVVFLDKEGMPIFRKTHFSKITLDGISYESLLELIEKLSSYN